MHLNMQSITQENIPNKAQMPHFSQSNLCITFDDAWNLYKGNLQC
jgi:hypothetical protein